MNTIEKAMKARRKTDGGQVQEAPVVGTPHPAPEGPAGPAPGAGSSQRVEIDLTRLRRQGFLTPDEGRSRLAEEMRQIKRAVLKNVEADEHLRVEDANLIMVTSSLPGEGKSFTAINLAISIAMELDKRVLLVDADVAKPSLHRYLGIEARHGLIDYLTDPHAELHQFLLKTNIPKLTLLPAGSTHQYATELLASGRMRALVEELQGRYPDRVVIFDSPPVLLTNEARVLASLVGQILVVVEAEHTPQETVKEALAAIADEEKVIGLVLNKNRRKSGGGYYGGYGYGYGYGHSPEAPE